MIKNIFQILLISILLISCKSRKVDGIWMYTNERSLTHENKWNINESRFIFDFDNNKVKILLKDTIFDAHFKFRKKLYIKSLGIQGKVDYKIIDNIIEIESEKDVVSVFKLLDLNYKLDSTNEEIVDFLINSELPKTPENALYDSEGKLINYLELDFKNDPYIYSSNNSIRILKSNYFDKHRNDGYWYVGNVKSNFFLFFSGDNVLDTNIYQIISLSNTKMKLKPLFESEISGVTELNVKSKKPNK